MLLFDVLNVERGAGENSTCVMSFHPNADTGVQDVCEPGDDAGELIDHVCDVLFTSAGLGVADLPDSRRRAGRVIRAGAGEWVWWCGLFSPSLSFCLSTPLLSL